MMGKGFKSIGSGVIIGKGFKPCIGVWTGGKCTGGKCGFCLAGERPFVGYKGLFGTGGRCTGGRWGRGFKSTFALEMIRGFTGITYLTYRFPRLRRRRRRRCGRRLLQIVEIPWVLKNRPGIPGWDQSGRKPLPRVRMISRCAAMRRFCVTLNISWTTRLKRLQILGISSFFDEVVIPHSTNNR